MELGRMFVRDLSMQDSSSCLVSYKEAGDITKGWFTKKLTKNPFTSFVTQEVQGNPLWTGKLYCPMVICHLGS